MLFILMTLFFSASADQTVLPSYGAARQVFWKKLYSDTHQSFYCNKTFHGKSGFNIEHVFAAAWMRTSVPECARTNRKRCRRLSKRFNLMEADLHNLYPTVIKANSARGSLIFGKSDGFNVYGGCPLKISTNIVEPPDYAKGRVARSILYMVYEYEIDLDLVTNSPGFEKEIIQWHCAFPAKQKEIDRNERIYKIQKTLNPFITTNELCL